MTKLRDLQVNAERRFETGCIATLTRPGETRTLHFTGAGADATRTVADYCDRHGFRVLTLATPGTVYRDLQGTRAVAKAHDVDSWFYAPPPVNYLDTPERLMLAKIGRGDLLA